MRTCEEWSRALWSSAEVTLFDARGAQRALFGSVPSAASRAPGKHMGAPRALSDHKLEEDSLPPALARLMH